MRFRDIRMYFGLEIEAEQEKLWVINTYYGRLFANFLGKLQSLDQDDNHNCRSLGTISSNCLLRKVLSVFDVVQSLLSLSAEMNSQLFRSFL